MRTSVLAAIMLAACVLSACGFVPPAPSKPSDSNRIAINRSDPRLYRQEVVAAAPAPTAAPIPVPPAPEQVQTQASAAPIAPVTSAAQPVAPASAVQSAPDTATTPTTATHVPSAPASTASTVETVQPVETTAGATPPEDLPPAKAPVIKRLWHISPSDGTVRQALTRWAAAENWTFGPDQWELNFDLPIQAQAEFEAESFQQATQALSQAIAMTESPVRPCFYANRVLRVIPFTRSCNRAPTATPSP